MPCTKCEEGNYKWGKTGECEYPTKEACESANSKYSKMQPTPLGKTYEEYAKELKEFNLSKVERVELALMDDLEKLHKEGSKLSGDASGSGLSAVRKAIQKADNDFTQLSRKSEDGIDKAEKFIKAAKELGVDAKQVQGYLNNFKSWSDDADYWIKQLNADQYN